MNIIIEKMSDININLLIGYIIALFAVVIAVIGWLVQYRLNVRANERSYINNIKNQARIEIIRNFKLKEEWLSDVSFFEHRCSMFIHGISSYQNVIDSFNNIALTKINSVEWIYTLESYEVLFPKITELRKKMVEIGIKTNEIFYKLISKAFNFSTHSTEDQMEFLNNVFKEYEFSSIFLDFRMLLNDLKIYIQNETIGNTVKHKAELRIPKDRNLPYLEILNNEIKIKNYDKYVDRIYRLQKFLELK